MEIGVGEGIAWGGTILGIVAVLFRVFPKSNGYVKKDIFDLNQKNIEGKFVTIESSLGKIEGKVDKLLEK